MAVIRGSSKSFSCFVEKGLFVPLALTSQLVGLPPANKRGGTLKKGTSAKPRVLGGKFLAVQNRVGNFAGVCGLSSKGVEMRCSLL